MAFTPYDPTVHTSHQLLEAILVPGTGVTIVPGSVNLGYGTGTTSDYASGASTSKTSVSFYNGSLPLGIGAGILLTSGDGTPPLSNTQSSYTVSFISDSAYTPDPELQAVATAAFSGAGTITDTSMLTFSLDVIDPNVKAVRIDLVFGSDEYPEWVNSSYVDIAAVIANGANYALFNGQPDQPLSVIQKNLDLGNFIDNTTNVLPIEYDGVSQLLTIIVPVNLGTNSFKIGVADTGDHAYDSGLFVANVQGVGYTGAGLAQVIDVKNTTQVTGAAGDVVYELNAPNWFGSFVFSSATPGNKTVVGGADDYIKTVFDFSLASLQDVAYSAYNPLAGTNSLSLFTPYGQYSLTSVDLVLFSDAAYALDTMKGGKTWQAYSLYQLAFGQAPSTQTLSQWVKNAQSTPDFTGLAAAFLQTYAPTASLNEVVSYLYQVVTGTVATASVLANVLNELAGSGIDTAPEVLAFAAENFADTAPILGQPLALDPSFFF